MHLREKAGKVPSTRATWVKATSARTSQEALGWPVHSMGTVTSLSLSVARA
jgi:hypothetical protein